MQRKIPLLGCKSAICFLTSMSILMGAGIASAKERSQFKAYFENDGIHLEARGNAQGAFKATKAKLGIRLRGLNANSAYSFLVGGQVEAEFVTDNDGEANVKLKSYTEDRLRMLDFEPREQLLEIHDGTSVVLTLDLGGSWDDLEIKSKEETNLIVLDPDSSATVRARHKVRFDGTERFSLKAKRLPEGVYNVFVDGIDRAAVTVTGAKGKLGIKFESVPTKASQLLLDFDARTAEVALVRDGEVFASGEMQSQARNVNVCDVLRTDAFLAPHIGTSLYATAEVRWRQDANCRREFDVELEDMNEDRVYDLYVDGVYEGTLDADDRDYEIEFKANDDEYDDDEHHLTFDPTAGLIEIREGDTVIFSDFLEAALATNSGGACRSTEIGAYLLNMDASDSQAYSEFRIRENCRSSFEIDVDGVASGNYDVIVDGVNQGRIEVESDSGRIEFESNADEDEDRLDFEPRLERVEISKDGVVIFSRTFPE